MLVLQLHANDLWDRELIDHSSSVGCRWDRPLYPFWGDDEKRLLLLLLIELTECFENEDSGGIIKPPFEHNLIVFGIIGLVGIFVTPF